MWAVACVSMYVCVHKEKYNYEFVAQQQTSLNWIARDGAIYKHNHIYIL